MHHFTQFAWDLGCLKSNNFYFLLREILVNEPFLSNPSMVSFSQEPPQCVTNTAGQLFNRTFSPLHPSTVVGRLESRLGRGSAAGSQRPPLIRGSLRAL